MPIHHRFQVLLFLMFFLGQFIHCWLKAASVVQSSTNGIADYGHYLKANGARVFSRLFIAYCMFSLWEWHGPELFTAITGLIPGTSGFLTAHPDPIPLNTATAGLFGYFSDSILESGFGYATKKWPSLQQYFPPEPGPAAKVDTTVVSATRIDKIVQTTTETTLEPTAKKEAS